MDFAKEARKLADEVLPENTSVKATLAFIEKVASRLEAAYNAGNRAGVKEGREKGRPRDTTWHKDWCTSEDCLGQCRER